MKKVIVLVVCLAILSGVMGNSMGPPAASFSDLVCNQLTPSPQAHGTPTPGDGGYQLEISPPMTETTDGFSYVPDTAYTSKLTATVEFICCPDSCTTNKYKYTS